VTVPRFDDPVQWMIPTACVWEVMARKVGNVHPGASFADVDAVSFLLSAAVVTPNFGNRSDYEDIGGTVLACVRRTRAVVESNTNLGILLLLTPLAHPGAPMDREGFSRHVLNTQTCGVAAARDVYEAIRIANPGGLGDAPEADVRTEPTITLLEAMALAADRDLVARQYANGFADVFDFGVPTFLDALNRFGCVEAGVIDAQLHWLAEYPDTLIARKAGAAAAADVQRRAADVLRLGGISTPEGRRAGVELDRHLRSDGNRLNPGAVADLITACLFVALRERKVAPTDSFRWQVSDWL
jgi:triphosphoribosyl-dephospho-CoA synthase